MMHFSWSSFRPTFFLLIAVLSLINYGYASPGGCLDLLMRLKSSLDHYTISPYERLLILEAWGEEIIDMPFPALRIEVEGYIRGPRQLVANRAYSLLSQYNPNVTVRRRRLGFGSVKENEYFLDYHYYGLFQRVEIKHETLANPGLTSVQVISPLIQNEWQAELFYFLIDDLKRGGLHAAPMSGGVHIHIDAPRITEQDVALIGMIYRMLEKELYSLFSVSTYRRNHNALFTSEGMLTLYEKLYHQQITLREFLHHPEANIEAGLNWSALVNHGTIEARLFNSSVDSRVIHLQRLIVSKLIYAIRRRDAKLREYLAQADTIQVHDFFLLLGIDITHYFRELESVSSARVPSQLPLFQAH